MPTPQATRRVDLRRGDDLVVQHDRDPPRCGSPAGGRRPRRSAGPSRPPLSRKSTVTEPAGAALLVDPGLGVVDALAGERGRAEAQRPPSSSACRLTRTALASASAGAEDRVEGELRGAAEDFGGLGRVLHAGQFDDDPVVAGAGERGFGDAERVDTAAQHLQRRRWPRRRLRGGGVAGLQDDLGAAAQVEARDGASCQGEDAARAVRATRPPLAPWRRESWFSSCTGRTGPRRGDRGAERRESRGVPGCGSDACAKRRSPAVARRVVREMRRGDDGRCRLHGSAQPGLLLPSGGEQGERVGRVGCDLRRVGERALKAGRVLRGTGRVLVTGDGVVTGCGEAARAPGADGAEAAPATAEAPASTEADGAEPPSSASRTAKSTGQRGAGRPRNPVTRHRAGGARVRSGAPGRRASGRSASPPRRPPSRTWPSIRRR